MKRPVPTAIVLCIALAALPAPNWGQHPGNGKLPPLPSGFTPTKEATMYSSYRDAGAGDSSSGEELNKFPPVCFDTVSDKLP